MFEAGSGSRMMFMPANHSSPVVHYLAGRFPNRIGWLIGPSARRKTKRRAWLPYALDNDAFSAWVKKTTWSEAEWRATLEWAATGPAPLWVLVPDAVADRDGTLERWELYHDVAAQYRWPLAFAVQDGMSIADVPKDADVVFVGGTYEWKWETVSMWAAHFSRVHVGRVNGIDKVRLCESIGVESVDGTGWFRDETRADKIPALLQWFGCDAQQLGDAHACVTLR